MAGGCIWGWDSKALLFLCYLRGLRGEGTKVWVMAGRLERAYVRSSPIWESILSRLTLSCSALIFVGLSLVLNWRDTEKSCWV